MKFLNGFKTVLGIVITVVATVAPTIAPTIIAVGDHVQGIAQGVGGVLVALGLIHKREKAKAAEGGQ